MKKLTTLALLLLAVGTARAQEMLGIANSNYAGTNGLSLNPSSMVDSRLSMDINLVTTGVSMDNDYIYIPKDSLKFLGFGHIVDLAGNRGYTDLNSFSFSNTSATYNLGVFAIARGPSATFHVKDHWFGIVTQVRGGATLSNIEAPIAKFGYEKDGIKYRPLHGTTFTSPAFDVAAMLWGEFGVTYGHSLINKEKNYLKGAITIKRLFGYASAWVHSNGFKYSVDSRDTTIISGTDTTASVIYSPMTIINPNVQYGHSFNESLSGTSYGDLINGTGWGFDIGFTYEYRPDYDKSRYEMDGKRVEDPLQNHYKLRLGVSIIDIGKITFDSKNTKDFDLSASSLSYWQNYDTLKLGNTLGFDNRVNDNTYGYTINASGDTLHNRSYRHDTYAMALPHALSMQADWNVHNRWYLNSTWIQHLSATAHGVVAADLISLTPRYEKDWIEFSMPMSMYQYDKFRLGFALRLGSFIVGSDKIGSVFGFSDLGGMDVYTSFKFSILGKRIKDNDYDGVSDKKDKCPNDKGTWATMGCPDRDHDGITDKEDDCPDIPGLPQFKGCPDRDGDGIMDKEDDCPDVKGLPQFKGCPDTDGDGIPDKDDMCPEVAGSVEMHGCPDTDGDGIPDKDDDCPDVKGLPQFKGCPDTDGDGLIDKLDSCPLVKGPMDNHGCPVIVKAPEPTAPVKVELTKEEQEVINKVFKNLEFETGKAIIRSTSFSALNELAELLKKKPNFKLLIDGHTDNVGKAAYNMKLSQNRANSVKLYLSDKGIDASRITAKGYGMTKPIASNKTAAGKQKNRRVEFTIVE